MAGTKRAKRPGRNVTRQKKAAKNLAKGMPQVTALIEAGYSADYASAQGYAAVKRPCIQSILTHLVEKVMTRRKMPMERIIEPYLDALDAPMVVKSTTEGIATIARDPDTQEIIPDHDVRMKAADRLTDLYGAKIAPKDEGTGTFTLEQLIDAMEKVKA
jgi:phage terminase small subunit